MDPKSNEEKQVTPLNEETKTDAAEEENQVEELESSSSEIESESEEAQPPQ